MKKRSHGDGRRSAAVVIPPRLSLGGKQASWTATTDDLLARKRLSVSGPQGLSNAATLSGSCGTGGIAPLAASANNNSTGELFTGSLAQVPPLHPHHMSAVDSYGATAALSAAGRNTIGGGVLTRSNSADVCSSASGSGTGGGSAGSGLGVTPSLASGASGYSSTTVVVPTTEILHTGVLVKRGHIFKTWLPRYFILTKTSLQYFRRNPTTGLPQEKDAAAVERRLLRGEILRGDLVRVETTEAFKKHHPFCFVLAVRRRPRGGTNSTRNVLSCMFAHHKESRLSAKKRGGVSSAATNSEDVVLYFIQAPRELDRQKWVRVLQRWIDGESPARLGRGILDYILNHEYNSARFEQKVGDGADQWHSSCISPVAVAGRKVEEDHPVLANLIRDMQDCQNEDEMIFILDQILGEVRDGAASANIKKLIATAGEVKLETSPKVWTQHVRTAYGNVMKALHTYGSASGAQSFQSTGRSSALRPTLLAPTRQLSDGGESAPESSFLRSYKLGRKLGSGAFSVVHIATHRETRKQVAVKCIAKAGLLRSDVLALKEEVDILSTLSHPNVVPLLDYFEEERYYYIVTPLCTGGELFDDLVKRKSYTEEDARVLMTKLASAVVYIHSRGIVHRDLKPENILLKTSAPGAEVMIADFGFARSMRGEKRWTACGTPGYVAPEVVRGEPYGSEVDCWSLGVILYILLCGYPPFPGENHAIIFEKVVSGKYKFASPDWDHVSEDAKDLVRKLLTVDRSKRLTAAGVLEHPWMNPPTLISSSDVSEQKRMIRVCSDLLPVLKQMRKHSLTHDVPKIRPSDMDIDIVELSQVSIEGDVELLDRELAILDF